MVNVSIQSCPRIRSRHTTLYRACLRTEATRWRHAQPFILDPLCLVPGPRQEAELALRVDMTRGDFCLPPPHPGHAYFMRNCEVADLFATWMRRCVPASSVSVLQVQLPDSWAYRQPGGAVVVPPPERVRRGRESKWRSVIWCAYNGRGWESPLAGRGRAAWVPRVLAGPVLSRREVKVEGEAWEEAKGQLGEDSYLKVEVDGRTIVAEQWAVELDFERDDSSLGFPFSTMAEHRMDAVRETDPGLTLVARDSVRFISMS